MLAVSLTWLKTTAARRVLSIVGVGLSVTACASVTPMPEGLASTGPGPSTDRSAASRSLAQTRPQTGPRYKVGAPYQVAGVWYVPAEQPAYEEVGLASWYGDEFNGKPTANGEIFEMNGISAAHATLPMPSIVEVTNLENGKSLRVRLNDRGPFHPGRIIDLSRGAAQELGFFNKGTAQVRVRFISAAPLVGMDAPTTFAANRMHALLPAEPSAPVGGADDRPVRFPSQMAAASPAAGGFAVQAGAFSDRGNAERVAAQLASAGRTDIQPLDRAGGRLYRVTVGSWVSADEAGAARQKVIALGFAQARVIGGS